MPVVTKYVSIRQPKGLVASFAPGEELPGWAIPLITNPAVLAESPESNETDETDDGTQPEKPNGAPETPAAPELSRPEIVAKAKALGIKAKGKSEELLAAIAAKEAEQNPPVEPANGESTDNGETSRPDLEAKAAALGIEFTAETSDAELELAITSANSKE
ncbi:MAG: hypothetical protein IJO71_09190 [Microbacterium sp.]|uniref:hypothetical protein n=1 Tax=Microbacterium sp. TaxID=51671 RepID=UPI0025F13B72|nr:hypothetical protein [Microbacterium sp.]MBQ9917360.1 hypothetical protein [Microbacterium sp.]